MAEITVYTTDPCSFCSRAKDLLSSAGSSTRRSISQGPGGTRAARRAHRDDELPPGRRRRRGRSAASRPTLACAADRARGQRLGAAARGVGTSGSPTRAGVARRAGTAGSARTRRSRAPRRRTSRPRRRRPGTARPGGGGRGTRPGRTRARRRRGGSRRSSRRPRRSPPPAPSRTAPRERLALRARQRPGRAQRMDPRAEQRLVGVDVPDAGDAALVEQERLDRRARARGRARAGARAVELAGRAARAPGGRRRTRRGAAAPTASSPVPKRRGSQKRSVGAPSSKREAHALVGRRSPRAGRQEQRPGHAQVHEQEDVVLAAPRRGTCRGGRGARPRRPSTASRERLGRERQAPARVEDLQRVERAPLDARGELAADRLDLGQLGHPSMPGVPGRPQAPGRVVGAVEDEPPAHGEALLPRVRPRDDRRRVALLDVAAAASRSPRRPSPAGRRPPPGARRVTPSTRAPRTTRRVAREASPP